MEQRNSSKLDEMMAVVEELEDKNSYEEAINILKKLANDTNNDPKITFRLGIILAKSGDIHVGINMMVSSALAAREKSMVRSLIIVLKNLEDYASALKVCNEFEDVINDDLESLIAWGILLNNLSMYTEAVRVTRRASEIAPDNPGVFHNLSAYLCTIGEYEDAVAAFGKRTIPWDPLTCSSAGLSELYASLAPRYEESELHQGFSQKLIQNILENRPNHKFQKVLDLGCGTGIMSKSLPADVDVLVGIDQSPEMSAKTAEKGSYTQLLVGDLATVMVELDTYFDTILSACVLYHISDLSEIFRQSSRLLKPGGVFAFSVDPIPDGQDIAIAHIPSDLGLRPSEYCHSRAYLRRLAQEVGLLEVSIKIDRHRGPPGFWCVFQKPDQN